MIDEVFDSAVEKKSPLILNFDHSALGDDFAFSDNNEDNHRLVCAVPAVMDFYTSNNYNYDCHHTLESIISRDSSFTSNGCNDENKDTDGIKKRTESRDPPPPFPETDEYESVIESERDPNVKANEIPNTNVVPKRPPSFLGANSSKDNKGAIASSTIRDTLCFPNGLLQKARGDTACVIATNTLEKSRKQNQNLESKSNQHQSPSETNNNNKKPANNRCMTRIPVAASLGNDSDAATLAAAAAKWRIAKEKYLVRACGSKEYKIENEIESQIESQIESESDSHDRYNALEDSISDSISDSGNQVGETDRDAAEQKVKVNTSPADADPTNTTIVEKTKRNLAHSSEAEELRNGVPTVSENRTIPSDTICNDFNSERVFIEEDASFHQRNSHQIRKPLDPPGTLSGTKEEEKSVDTNSNETTGGPSNLGDVDSRIRSTTFLKVETENQQQCNAETCCNDEGDTKSAQEQEDKQQSLSYMYEFSRSLRQLEDRQEAHRSILIEYQNRLKQQKNKKN